ncbi:MAG: hypothetical protein CMQ41_15520 [Gammaproteobacteria bacterium]|nr:hypothetical protein [Gammaproteobacteria bacterium]
MSDTELEVKAPWDAIDILPQERITGDILRGRGPRRGNLERLLKYWRPIMRKPGGFRRCIIILANHPELYPLQPLCAWLHHETTGLWPNEGNHHEGGKLGPVLRGFGGRAARRVVPGKRRRRRRKSDDGAVEMASWRLYRRHSRAIKGVSTQLINGNVNAVDFKAARFVAGFQSVPVPSTWEWDENYPNDVKVETFEDLLSTKVGLVTSHGRLGRSLQGLASFFIPGDMGKYRSPLRSALYGALTPGGGGGRGMGGGRPSIGGRALRCPTGYVNGGRFTDPSLTNCGGLVFDVPADGPGAVTAADRSKITRRFRGGDDLEDVARDIVVKKPKGDPFAVVREAAMKPKSTPNEKRRNSVVTDVTSYASENKNTTRIVRRDGVVFEPRVGPDELVKMRGHDNLKDSVYVTSKIPRRGSLASDELRLLTKGVKSVDYVFPEGTLKVERKKEISSTVGAKMRTRWSALSRDPDVQINPIQAIENWVREFPKEIEITSTFKKIPNANERVVVYSSTGERRIVPKWVFSLYLSDKAPRRPKGRKPFTTVRPKNGEKVIHHKRPERDEYAALLVEYKSLGFNADFRMPVHKKNVSDIRISHTYGLNKDSLIDIKAARLDLAPHYQEMAIKRLGRRSLAGRSISRMARRMPKVVPYDRNARDGDNDGIVQEGTIWERPNGALFRGVRDGARKLVGSVDLVDANGNQIDYKPGDHERSPLRRRDVGQRRRELGERVIRDRDERMGAEADFGPIERRRELRRLRLQRAMRGIERTPDRRERRADRLDARAQRDEDRGRADLELAEEIRQFRIERNEMEDRHRREMAELNERNPRSRGRNRERRQERREERRDRMDERLVRAGEAGDRLIRRRDEREGAEAVFEPRRERRGIRDRVDAGLARAGERAGDLIDRRDREAGAAADFREIDERNRERRERRAGIGQRMRDILGVKKRDQSEREMEDRMIGNVADDDREDARVALEVDILNAENIGIPEHNEKEMAAIAKAQVVGELLPESEVEDEVDINWVTNLLGESGISIVDSPELRDVFDEEMIEIKAFLEDVNDEELGVAGRWRGVSLGDNFVRTFEDDGRGSPRSFVRLSVGALRNIARLDDDDDGSIWDHDRIVADLERNNGDDGVVEFSISRLEKRLATLEKAQTTKRAAIMYSAKEIDGFRIDDDGVIDYRLRAVGDDRIDTEDQRDRFAHYVRIEMAKQDNDKILEEKAKILSTLDDLNRTPGDVVDAVVADVPDPIQAIRNQDIDEFEAELVAHLLDKRFDVVSKQYDRTGKPKINPEDHGLDKDSLIAAIQNDDITPIKSQLESFFQSALRLGEGNTFQGVDGWEFRILNRNGETPVLDYSGRQGRLDVSLGSSEGKIWYRKRNRNGTWTDWSNDQGGYTKRTISFKVSNDGTLQIDPQNRMMFPSGNGSKLKGSGFATFFNYNAFLHWKQLGAEKVHVTTSTDGPVFWAMQGFDNPDVTKRVLKRLKDAIDNNDMNTPIQTDEQRERMLRIWEMHQSGRPVNMLMIHSALKWDGKHDWEKLSISRNADGTYKKARRNLGIAKTRYGQWFLDNGRMSEGWFHLGDETPIGKYLNGIIGNIGNMDEIDDNIADPWGGRGAYVVNNGRVVRGPVRASIGGSQLGTNDRLYPVTDPVVIGDLERRGLRPMTAIGQNDRDQLVAGAR